MTTSVPARRVIAGACLFLSGAAGLVYEVCWIRKASLVFGSTLYALSTVLAVFFLGLAVGSELFGRLSPRISRPLRVYALIELGVAILALLSLPAFDVADRLYGLAYRSAGGDTGPAWLARLLGVSIVLLPPTVLMGGTLPLLTRIFVVERSRIALPVGLLYALNTLGAVAGCAAGGFALIPTIGMQGAVVSGAALNLVAAAGIGLARDRGGVPPGDPARPPAFASLDTSAWVLALAFLAGFAALGYEVLWTRYLSLLVRNTVTTYTVTLVVVLAGIVLGSTLTSGFYDRARRRGAIFGGLQVAAGLSVLGVMMIPAAVWRSVAQPWVVYAALILPPAILGGASFPLAVRMVVDQPSGAGPGLGRVAAANTLGGILGSVAIGFVVLPKLGLYHGIQFASGLSLATGFLAWIALEGARFARLWAPIAVASLLVWLAIPRITGARVPDDFLADRGALVDVREGLQSHLAVIRNKGVLELQIDRWWQGQDRKTHQIMAAHLPMLMHPRPRRVLVVGAGVGQTASRFALYDIERLDCVDIEPSVFDLIRAHFAAGWLDDPRTRIIRTDGRNYLMHTAERYDVISLELGQIFRPGVSSFYTAEFYRRARRRLEPGGILTQFVPLPFLSRSSFRSVIATFLDVFPHSTLWYNTSELLLVGRADGSPKLDLRRFGRAASEPALRDDLRFSYWGGPAQWLNRPDVLLAGFLCGPAGLTALSRGAPILHDDRPVLEYAAARAAEGVSTELEPLEALTPHLESVRVIMRQRPAPGAFLEIDATREKNLADIRASAILRSVDLEGGDLAVATADIARAIRANPENVAAHRLMATALLLQSRYDDARQACARALALDPDDALAHLVLAQSFHRQGRTAEATPHYEASLSFDPRNEEAWNGLGAALGQTGDLEGALRRFEQALAIRPDYVEARRNLERTRAALRSRRR